MSIQQPEIMFTQPFANSGDKGILPDISPTFGRADMANGFPVATQLPLAAGGVAPNRTDFNSILFMLSAYAFWNQSGGLWAWNNKLDYAVPSMVYHGGELYSCLAPSGPGTSAGIKTPGVDTGYWEPIKQVAAGTFFGTSAPSVSLGKDGDIYFLYGTTQAVYEKVGGVWYQRLTIPTGDEHIGFVHFYAATAVPNRYLICNGAAISRTTYAKLFAKIGTVFGAGNGSTTFNLPDLRGHFIRAFDANRGIDNGREFGSVQDCAIENITGSALGFFKTGGGFTGALYYSVPYNLQPGSGSSIGYQELNIDASRVVRTASETRPINTALYACIGAY